MRTAKVSPHAVGDCYDLPQTMLGCGGSTKAEARLHAIPAGGQTPSSITRTGPG